MCTTTQPDVRRVITYVADRHNIVTAADGGDERDWIQRRLQRYIRR